jgi:hypothetical protein
VQRPRKKPASQTGGLESSFRRSFLERDLSCEDDSTLHAIGQRGVSKARSLLGQPCILKEGVNALEVGVIEGVDHGGVELERRSFGELDPLEDSEINDVRESILGHVAGRVAKGRTE